MFGNLLLGLTSTTYLALIIFNLQKVNATGERLMGYAFIGFVIMAAYAVSSLLLTIFITSKGGFNWLSDTKTLRNIGVGILWSGMVAGVVYCAMARMEFRSSAHLSGMWNLLSLPVYFGSLWLPLLMLVPYAIILNPEWQSTLSPFFYKAPLLLGCFLGFGLVLIPKIVRTAKTVRHTESADSSQWAFNASMQEINKYQDPSIKGLLSHTHRNNDERIRSAAVSKIKSYENWEGELMEMLNHSELSDVYWGYAFLDGNKIDHPADFIQPLKKSLPLMADGLQKSLSDPNSLYIGYIQIETVCRVLETQFKDSFALFLPDMLRLQEILNKTPPERTSKQDKQYFDESLNSYRLAVKNWLDSHQ
ncbi:MAG: hypothetical protein IPN15_20885 [Saprospiraceae bacterium]|nr:hypothetical protein [Candidatus Vicinibacter affinis]